LISHTNEDVNEAIREKLSQGAIIAISIIASKLSDFLWSDIDKTINLMNVQLKIPGKLKEMIGTDETNEKNDIRLCFEAVIRTLAEPAIIIFLSQPRCKNRRINFLRIHEMELIVLDVFIVEGKRKPRGIVQFIANGKLGPFHFEVINPNNCDNKSKICASKKPVESASVYTQNSKQHNTKNKPPLKPHENKIEEPIEDATNNDENIFDNLKFSGPSFTFEQVCDEIEKDFNEFLECMKNSVFYHSRIQISYNLQLEKYKKRFIHSEDVWKTHVSKY
jgi:hypothetical protein